MANKTTTQTKTTTTKKIALRAAPKRAAKVPAKKTAKRSHLELRWIREWQRQGGPELVEEYQFHPTRRWRADFAHLESKTLIEIEGGAFGGRHTRGKGFVEDLDKYASAWLHGYTVLRIGAHQVRGDIIRAVIGRLRAAESGANSPESWEAAENSPESWAGGGSAAPAWLGGGAGSGAECLADEMGGGVGIFG
jgi:very-short-patch-repair endonuclease